MKTTLKNIASKAAKAANEFAKHFVFDNREKRDQLIGYMNSSEEQFIKVYAYLNGCLCQCYSFQAEYIIDTPNELCNESVDKLYKYIFG